MRNEIQTAFHDGKSEELYYPYIGKDEAEIDILIMKESNISNGELEQLYQEAQEYDFLNGKTPRILPDYWEEED